MKILENELADNIYITPGGLYHDNIESGPRKIWGVVSHEKAHYLTGKKLVGNITLDWNLSRPDRVPVE